MEDQINTKEQVESEGRTESAEPERKDRKWRKKWLTNGKALLVYWLVFAISLLYWELLVKGVTGGFSGGGSFFFLCFIPAEALFLSMLVGWFPERANRFLTPVVLGVVSVYYIIQVGYHKAFGSLFSVSLLGMGNAAMTDFGWTMKTIVKDTLGACLLILIPVAVLVLLGILRGIPCRRYSVLSHLCIPVLAVILWFMGVGILRLGGAGRGSAYDAYSNSLSDTDTTANKLGASTTTILEINSYFFGIGGGKSRDTLSQGVRDALTVSESGDWNIMLGGKEEPDASLVTGTKEDSTEESATPSEEVSTVPERRIFEEIDFATLKRLSDDAVIQNLCDYFSTIEGSSTNEYTGLMEGYNLIYICAESFWTYAINEVATPTLYKMANGGIVLDNYYNSFKNTTTNGEFAFLTSLWPDVSRDAMMGKDVGSFPQSASKYMPYGLGNITEALGYKAYGYHNFKGSYYRREDSLANLGLECKFMGSGMSFTTSWPSSDLEMMEQSVDDYIHEDRFITYYMTFSGHGPYNNDNAICSKNYDRAVELTQGMGLNDQAICYLACNMELDKAMEYLLMRLEEAGKLENTLIVIAGDHYPYYVSGKTRKSLAGHTVDTDFEMYKSSCILYNAGIREPLHSDTYCCNVDILPTVLNLLDIPYDSRLIAGKDIFAEGLHKAVLYNKSFLTDTVKYNALTGEREWLIDVSGYTEEQKDAYIEAISERIGLEYAASLNMMDCDFYRFVWENSGLIPETE